MLKTETNTGSVLIWVIGLFLAIWMLCAVSVKANTFKEFLVYEEPRSFGSGVGFGSLESGFGSGLAGSRGLSSLVSLPSNEKPCEDNCPYLYPVGPFYEYVPLGQVITAAASFVLAFILLRWSGRTLGTTCLAVTLILFGGCMLLVGHEWYSPKNHHTYPYPPELLNQSFQHNTDKQIAVIAALAEGSSIRSIERIDANGY